MKDVYYGYGTRPNDRRSNYRTHGSDGFQSRSNSPQEVKSRSRKRFRPDEEYRLLEKPRYYGSTRTALQGRSYGSHSNSTNMDPGVKSSKESLRWIYPPPATSMVPDNMALSMQTVPQPGASLPYWPGTYPICPVPVAAVAPQMRNLENFSPGYVLITPSNANLPSVKSDSERSGYVRTVINGVTTTVPLPRKSTLIPEDKETGTLGHSAANRSHGLFKSDDWKCAVCLNINWARRTVCNLCHTPRPELAHSSSGYEKQRSGASSQSRSRSYSRSPSQSPPRQSIRKRFAKYSLLERTPKSMPHSPIAEPRSDVCAHLEPLEREREPDDNDLLMVDQSPRAQVPPSSPSIYWNPNLLNNLEKQHLILPKDQPTLNAFPVESSSAYLPILGATKEADLKPIAQSSAPIPATGTYKLLHQQAIAEYLRVQKVQNGIGNLALPHPAQGAKIPPSTDKLQSDNRSIWKQ